MAKSLALYERQEGEVTGTLDGGTNHSLGNGSVSASAARLNLAELVGVTLDESKVLVVNFLDGSGYGCATGSLDRVATLEDRFTWRHESWLKWNVVNVDLLFWVCLLWGFTSWLAA